jgi:HK97 family phage portal protein
MGFFFAARASSPRIEPRLAPRADASPAPDDDYWYRGSQIGSGVAQSGAVVTPDTALRVSAVYACVRILAQSLAMLPLIVYRVSDSGRIKAADHPLYMLLRTRPNSWQTAYEFRLMMMGHLALRGNAYARIIGSPDGSIAELRPLHPDRVRVVRLTNGAIRYDVTDPNTSVVASYVQSEILHIRGLTSDGIVGLSPIAIARESIGGALATQDYSNRLFRNNARPSGVLTVPGKLSDQAAKRLKSDWATLHGGENVHGTAILEDGMLWKETGMTPEDAQFLQTRKFQIDDVARIFGVPPHMLGVLERSTMNNIEHQGIDFVTHTLMPWLVAWEQAIGRDLMTESERAELSVEFQVDALLRGDTESRYAGYAIGRQWGWLNVNEIRAREGLDPVDGGDMYLRPLNMVDATDPAGAPSGPPGGGAKPPKGETP